MNANAAVSYVMASATPVTLTVAGTLSRPGNVLEALIGQGQVGSVSAGSYQLNDYQWSYPSGVVFKSATWGTETYTNAGDVVKASHHYNPLASGDLIQESLGFFAAYPTTESVQVSVDVRLPSQDPNDPNADGPLIGRVSLTKGVQIIAPDLKYEATHFGTSRLSASNVLPSDFDSGDYQSGNYDDCGARFKYQVDSVPEFTISEGFSQAGLSQLMVVDYRRTIEIPFSSGGAWVLDTRLHYDSFSDADDTLYYGNQQTDTPGMGISAATWGPRDLSASSSTSFHMFLTYQPPDGGCGTTIVPLAYEGWNWISEASEYPTADYQWDDTMGTTGA